MDESEKIPVAVVGVGYLGKYHAEKYAASTKAELVAVVDIAHERAAQVASQWGGAALADYRELYGKVRCVSIAVPTRYHHAVAREFLERGIDTLIEKPLAMDFAEGQELVDIAKREQAILQVGHLERFNPAIRRLESVIRDPKFVECH